jgi:hypothetical protein
MLRRVNELNPVSKSLTGSGSAEYAELRKVAKTNTTEIRTGLAFIFIFTCKKGKDNGF